MNHFLNFPASLSDPRGWYWSRLVLGWCWYWNGQAAVGMGMVMVKQRLVWEW
jgi:hypothetical protein